MYNLHSFTLLCLLIGFFFYNFARIIKNVAKLAILLFVFRPVVVALFSTFSESFSIHNNRRRTTYHGT